VQLKVFEPHGQGLVRAKRVILYDAATMARSGAYTRATPKRRRRNGHFQMQPENPLSDRPIIKRSR
jgi:hypothetical protein